MATQDVHPYFTLGLAIWAPIGPLVGIAIAHLLSKNWQRRQWELDNVKDETRELLTALHALVPAFAVWVRRNRTGLGAFAKINERQEDVDKLHSAYTDKSVAFYRVMRDRLFIVEEVKRLEIRKRWESAMKDFEKTYNETALEKDVEGISMSIVSIARR